MKTLLALTLLMLSACAKPAATPITMLGSWTDIENFRSEFKADGTMTIEACGITGSYTEPTQGRMTLFVSTSTHCLEPGLHDCAIDVSGSTAQISCGLLQTYMVKD